MKHWVLISLSFILLISACVRREERNQPTPILPDTPISTVTYDISYGAADSESQKLDIYFPESIAAPLPVMIYVHGGAWSIGNKSAVQFKDDVFNSSGYIFISINYRLSPEGTWEEMAEDVALAVAWVYENINVNGGDPGRIFLMGHSAGAHLVSLVATDERYLQNIGLDLDALSGVVSLDTRAYNIPTLETKEGVLPRVYAPIFGDDPAQWEAASPLWHVETGKNIPPIAIAWSKGMLGNNDNATLRETPAREFYDVLDAAGISALLVDGSTKTHAEINRQFGEPNNALTETIMNWLKLILEN
jgi:acetyl esterase/lipase